jgi:hypothetical protein
MHSLPWRGSVWTCSKATGSLLHNFLSPAKVDMLYDVVWKKGMARTNRGGGVSRLQFSTCLDLVFTDLHVSSLVERKAYVTANNGCASNLVHVLWFQRGGGGYATPTDGPLRPRLNGLEDTTVARHRIVLFLDSKLLTLGTDILLDAKVAMVVQNARQLLIGKCLGYALASPNRRIRSHSYFSHT